MRFLIALAFVLIPLQAMSLKDFNEKPAADRSAYVATFIDKMTTHLRAKNEKTATAIRDWFAVRQEGKPLSEGMERLAVELGAIEIQAKEGKADLSKIQLESVIVYLVKQKFSLGLVIPPQVVVPIIPSRQKFQPSAAMERALPKILHAAA